MSRHRNIVRIDNPKSRTHAWRVTLQRQNRIVAKSFSDGICGGKRKALQAAIAYRNWLLAECSIAEHRHWVRNRLRRNNTSGIPGVGRYEALANPDTGRCKAFWLASWIDERGASRKRKFSVSCHGERQAKRLAIAEREQQLQRVCAIGRTKR